jgi:hypothetical protein
VRVEGVIAGKSRITKSSFGDARLFGVPPGENVLEAVAYFRDVAHSESPLICGEAIPWNPGLSDHPSAAVGAEPDQLRESIAPPRAKQSVVQRLDDGSLGNDGPHAKQILRFASTRTI